MASVFSLKAEQRRCHDNSDKPQRRRIKFEDHGGTIILPFGFVKIVDRISKHARPL
jgi:hypothetical protein